MIKTSGPVTIAVVLALGGGLGTAGMSAVHHLQSSVEDDADSPTNLAALAAEEHYTLRGTYTVIDVEGALVGSIGLKPGSSSRNLPAATLGQLETQREIVEVGGTVPCPGGSGGRYGDISRGAKLTVRDQDKHAIAKAQLTDGMLSEAGCTFIFEVMVPKVQSYSLVFAKRDGQVFSASQLDAEGWYIATGPR